MAQKPAVHIEPRGKQWAVVREGNERATSTHPTQSEAADVGRDLARRDGTEFFLHGKDGQIREHRDYREAQAPEYEGIVDTVTETVGTVSDLVGGASGAAMQSTGGARQETEGKVADRESDRTESVADTTPGGESSDEGVERKVREEPSGRPEERYAGYSIYDQYGERIGPLYELFVDVDDEPEYVGVGTGLSDNRSVLVPAEAITIDDRQRRMVVSHPRSVVQTAPSLGFTDEVTPEFERRVRIHYGLDTEERAGYGAYYYASAAGPTEISGAEPAPHVSDQEDDDLRVRRSEEELRVEMREREAGEMRVRKRVRTERERLTVPKKRVEVSVERVPVEGATTEEEAAAAPEIGEEEIVVPVVEEEIVVEKRPVVKEEIRIRKQVVEDTEVVEEDVRREEVEIVDDTGRGAGSDAGPKDGAQHDDGSGED